MGIIRKLPKNPKARKQVKTYLAKHGREGYRKAGKMGGGANSPGSFNSESARRASLIYWARRREQENNNKELDDGS